jgi:signal transduction histidine kinase
MGIRQALFAPIRHHGQILGAIMALGTDEVAIQAADLPVAVAMAERAAAAIDRAALHTEAQEQRRFLAHLIEAAPIGIAVVRGPRHVYQVANAAYRTFKGGGEIVGRRYDEVTTVRDSLWAERGLPRLDDVVHTGRPLRLTDIPVPDEGGASRYFSFDISPLPPDRAQPAGALILTWDTTDRVLAAERLEQLAHQSQAHAAEMQAIIACMAEGVIATDEENRIRLANDAAVSLLGEIPTDGSVHPWDLARQLEPHAFDQEPITEEQVRATWETDAPLLGREFAVRGPDGRDRAIRMSLAPRTGSDGVRAGMVAVIEDITDRRALEETREEFLAQASHELRTPLTSMLGFLQLVERRMQRDPSASPVVRESISGALTQALRLRTLVNDLLDATRLRQGRLDLRREPCDLAELVAGVADELREAAATSGQTIVTDLPPAPVIGEWDADRLRQVVTNLIENAIKYSHTGGTIRIAARARRQEAVIEVEDHGIGIPASEIPKLFRPFGRAEHPATRNIPGFGLGLYICKDIVDRHGGRIRVRSRPGHGSTFTVSLPLRPP